jgi:hypothetical protein
MATHTSPRLLRLAVCRRPRPASGARQPLLAAAAAVLMPAVFAFPAAADTLSGTWRLERYEGGGSTGPASGLLLLADGHFSLIYAMDDPGHAMAGRAHAGRYEVDGDALTFKVEWSIERVGGDASVSRRPAERVTRFTLRGEDLTVHFENGAIQQFRRIRPAGDAHGGGEIPAGEHQESRESGVPGT